MKATILYSSMDPLQVVKDTTPGRGAVKSSKSGVAASRDVIVF
jgi:hypothetical protein